MTGINCSVVLHHCISYIILYWFIYFLTCFACLLVFSYIFTNNRSGLYNLQYAKDYLLFRACLIICIISLAGFPPFAGFWAKLILAVIVMRSASIFYLIILWCLLLLSLLFYLRLLRYFYAWSASSNKIAVYVRNAHINILVWLVFFICCSGLLINDLMLIFISFLL